MELIEGKLAGYTRPEWHQKPTDIYRILYKQ